MTVKTEHKSTQSKNLCSIKKKKKSDKVNTNKKSFVTVKNKSIVKKKVGGKKRLLSSKKNDTYFQHFDPDTCSNFDFESDFISEKQKWVSLNRVIYQYPKENSSFIQQEKSLLNSIKVSATEFKLKPNTLKASDIVLAEELIGKINFKKLSGINKELLVIMNQYVDIYYPEAKLNHDLRHLFSFHCLNHVMKERELILKHHETMVNYEANEYLRYHGYTRPKVLILTPFKNCAYNIVKSMMSLLSRDIIRKKKFERVYGPPTEIPQKGRLKKPKDFLEMFEGDTNEDFHIGLTITKGSLKLFCEMYESDIIIGSPMTIRRFMESNGEGNKMDIDFLSSIEIFVLDMADVFTMQNWEHVTMIQESLNQPLNNLKNLYGDVMRVRQWFLDYESRHFRQNIFLGSTYNDCNVNLLEAEKNFCGRVQVLNVIEGGSSSDVTVTADLILRRVCNGDESFSPNAHFKYFTDHVYPDLRLNQCGHTLIYVPDYFDYNRIVSFMKEDCGTSISTINEYLIADTIKVAKARGRFFDGQTKYLIYTERYHFYKRNPVKGIQHILFYNLPSYPQFFSELSNFMAEEFQHKSSLPVIGANTITALYQPAEFSKLAGVLGTRVATQILQSDKPVHKCTIGQINENS